MTEQIKYPEEVRVEAAAAQLLKVLKSKRFVRRLLFLIRTEAEKGKVYGHFC